MMLKSLFSRKNKSDIKQEASRMKIEREKSELEKKLGKLNAEIQRLVNAGNMNSARTVAIKFVRTKRALEKIIMKIQSNLETVAERVQVARTIREVGDGIARANEEISKMEKVSTSSAAAQLLGTFEAQGEMLEAATELIDDICEEPFEAEHDEADVMVDEAMEAAGLDLRVRLDENTFAENAPSPTCCNIM